MQIIADSALGAEAHLDELESGVVTSSHELRPVRKVAQPLIQTIGVLRHFWITFADFEFRLLDTSQSIPEAEERTMCTLYNHGIMVRYLKMLGYWPPPGHIGSSVLEVARHIIETPKINVPICRVASGTGVAANPAGQHADCDAGKILKSKIKDLLEHIDTPVDDAALEEIRRKARKSEVDVLGQQRSAGQ